MTTSAADNTDMRYANKTTVSGKELVYGVTLNNTQRWEDCGTATPAWGYPFIAPDSTPSPAAARSSMGRWLRMCGIGRIHHVGPARVLCRNPVPLRPCGRCPANNGSLLYL